MYKMYDTKCIIQNVQYKMYDTKSIYHRGCFTQWSDARRVHSLWEARGVNVQYKMYNTKCIIWNVYYNV